MFDSLLLVYHSRNINVIDIFFLSRIFWRIQNILFLTKSNPKKKKELFEYLSHIHTHTHTHTRMGYWISDHISGLLVYGL